MATTIGRRYVAAPNPLVSRSTFFKVSTGPLAMPDHAGAGGLEYQISHCGYPDCYEIVCQTSEDRESKTLDGAVTLIQGDPFVVYSSIDCSPVGMTDEQMQVWLSNKLEMGVQATIENVFSQQLCGQSPGLSNNDAVVDLNTATDIVDAVSQLENYLYVTAEYGVAGVLHVPLKFAPYFQFLYLIDPAGMVNGVNRTPLGTAINFGNYAGLDPSGGDPAAGSSYIYITGQTAVYRQTPVFSPPRRDVLNRTTNKVTGVMEQEYLVTFDCAAAGIEAPLSGTVE